MSTGYDERHPGFSTAPPHVSQVTGRACETTRPAIEGSTLKVYPKCIVPDVSEPEDPQPQPQNAMFTKVVLALLSDRPADGYLEAQRERHLSVMRELTAVRRDASLQDRLLVDYQLFHIEADLRWIDHTVERLGAVMRAIQL